MKKVGIVGCGGIAQVHAWVLQNMKDVGLIAFCDSDESKARRLAEKVYAESGRIGNRLELVICSDWKKFLELDLDVIHLCTPHYLHAPMAMEFLKNGKAVFVEKPCAITREQFEELRKADEANPGRLGFCFQNRYNDATILLDQWVEDGQIGKVTGGRAFVTWRRDEEYYAESDWKGSLLTEGGGALINQSIHTLDLLLRYLGEPMTVKGSIANHHLSEVGTGKGKTRKIEVEDTVEAWMEFQGGKRACFYASNGYAADAPVILELQGDKGRITLMGSELTLWRRNAPPEHVDCEREIGMGKAYWGCGHRACIRDFYQKLDGREPYQNDLKGVENTFQTMMRIYEDAR